MPPGWSHTGDHKTAKLVRDEYLKPKSEVCKKQLDNNVINNVEMPFKMERAKQIS